MSSSSESRRAEQAIRPSAFAGRTSCEFVAGSPAAIVFGGAPPSWRDVVLSSSGATLALYALVGVGLARAGHWLQPPLRVVEPTLQVELPDPPPPLPPEPAPAPEPLAKAAPPRVLEKAPRAAPAPEPARSDSPPPPAEAGEVVTAEPDAPADFTNFSITTGKGARYRGGVTASSGTSQRAVHSAVIDRAGAVGSSGALSLAKPVRLEVRHWKCPWPDEADLLAVDEETVVLGVEVDADGVVKSAAIVSDPGHGFGVAALRCARQNRFLPATNELGQPISATSPPLRVRFSRPR